MLKKYNIDTKFAERLKHYGKIHFQVTTILEICKLGIQIQSIIEISI